MIKKTMQLFSVLIAIIGTLSLSAQKKWSLNEVVDYAFKHNYNHQKQILNKAITYEKTNEVLTMGFPKINGSVGYQNNFQIPTTLLPAEIAGGPAGAFVPVQFGLPNNANVSLNLQQLIFDGRYLVGVQARSAIKSLANAQLEMSTQSVKELIYKLFYQSLVAEQSVIALEENEKIIKQLYDETQKTYKAGLVEELDVERMQYNLLNIQNILANTKNQYEVLKYALKFNMGYPMDSVLEIDGSLTNDLESVKNEVANFDFDINKKPEFKMIEQNEKIKKYDLRQTEAGYLPSLYGFAGYGWQAFRRSFDFLGGGDWFSYGNFGVQLQVPIFDGLTRKYQVSQAKLEWKKAIISKEEYMNASRIEVIQSQLNLKNAINEYENNNNILNLSSKIQNKSRIKYKEGVGSSFELAQAQNERVQQQLRTLQSILNVAVKGIEFRKSIGKL
jgi:outer membrane protein TolC